MHITLLLLVSVLAGCASSSGVLKQGPDTYTVTTSASPGRGGVPTAKRMAYDEAAAECAKHSREVLAMGETSNLPTWNSGMAMTTLNFQCLAKGDPDLRRPTFQKSPDTVIEVRTQK